MNLPLFLFGGCRLRVLPASLTSVLDLCLSRGYTYTDVTLCEDGSMCFSLPLSVARALLRDAEARGLAVTREKSFGLPAYLARLARRPGLLIGGVLGALLLVLSGRFVWAVEVTGNETLPTEEVREILRDCGFGVGSYLPAVEVPSLENRILISTDRLSWISINLDGTVASVQVVERREEIPAEEETRPANLVAARDGQIEYLELFRGQRAVSVGQAVKAGELLVSGVYESATVGCRFTRAAGKVFARTERTFEIGIPYAWEEKQSETPVLCALTLDFFNFSLNFFENSGNVGESCDIIETEKVLPSFGKHALPISLSVTTATPYTYVPRTRTREEAIALAYEALERELSALSASAVLLGKEIRSEVGETEVRLVCTVTAVEDIARVQEFEVAE